MSIVQRSPKLKRTKQLPPIHPTVPRSVANAPVQHNYIAVLNSPRLSVVHRSSNKDDSSAKHSLPELRKYVNSLADDNWHEEIEEEPYLQEIESDLPDEVSGIRVDKIQFKDFGLAILQYQDHSFIVGKDMMRDVVRSALGRLSHHINMQRLAKKCHNDSQYNDIFVEQGVTHTPVRTEHCILVKDTSVVLDMMTYKKVSIIDYVAVYPAKAKLELGAVNYTLEGFDFKVWREEGCRTILLVPEMLNAIADREHDLFGITDVEEYSCYEHLRTNSAGWTKLDDDDNHYQHTAVDEENYTVYTSWYEYGDKDSVQLSVLYGVSCEKSRSK